MLIKASDIKGFKITATDGSIGTVTDFLFDDESWTLRWIVVDTGTWLSGRKVLLPVSVLRMKTSLEQGLQRQVHGVAPRLPDVASGLDTGHGPGALG